MERYQIRKIWWATLCLFTATQVSTIFIQRARESWIARWDGERRNRIIMMTYDSIDGNMTIDNERSYEL